MIIKTALFSALLGLCLLLQVKGEDTFAVPGNWDVQILRMEWQDTTRQREVPAKIYLPHSKAGTTSKAPVIIFSHGLGGTRETYEYLGRHWASHGFVAVHLQHLGSDDSVWRGKPRPLESMREAVADLRNALNRPKDVSFAIDRLTELNRTDGALKGRLDLDSIGAAGHSFGSYTVLAVAGQGARAGAAKDKRIKAGVAMSAPVNNGARGTSFEAIDIPLLHFTGTEDVSQVIPGGSASDRRIPFDRINGPEQFLVIFSGGDHMVFSGRRGQQDEEMLRVIRAGTTAFWNAYLRDDAEARKWLRRDGSFPQVLGKLGTLEEKVPAP